MMGFRQKLLVSAKNLTTSSTNMAPAAAATVTLDNMNPCIKKMEYAVRGPLVIRATAIEKVNTNDFFQLSLCHIFTIIVTVIVT